MAQFAIVENGIVQSIVVADTPLDPSWIEVSPNQEAQVGWIHNFVDNTFRDPTPAPLEVTPNIIVTSATLRTAVGANGLSHVFPSGVTTTITGTIQEVDAGVYNLPIAGFTANELTYVVFTVSEDNTFTFDLPITYGTFYIDWLTFGTNEGTGAVETDYIVFDDEGNDLNLYLIGI